MVERAPYDVHELLCTCSECESELPIAHLMPAVRDRLTLREEPDT